MQTTMLRTDGAKDHLINQIIDREWKMFQQVENIGGRASCQDDMDTFYIMRYSQHSLLSNNTLESYRQDLIGAEREERNLVMEKYAYMMETTDPEYFHANIEKEIPRITGEKATVVAEIRLLMGRFYSDFATTHPKYTSRGRSAEGGNGETSISVYLTGELKTYSLRTLTLFLEDIKASGDRGGNPVADIQAKMVEFYGYNTIEDAERRM